MGYKAGLFLFSSDTNNKLWKFHFQSLSGWRILLKEPAPVSGSENLLTGQVLSAVEKSAITAPGNFCAENTEFAEESDKKFCSERSKLFELRGIEVDLTAQKALLYDGGKLIKVLNLAYQSPEFKWFEAPTGYYNIGVKHEKHLSSIFPVTMPYSMQYYQDFFIHGIPYHRDGTLVSSDFTGGCLRFKDEEIKKIYDFTKTGDQVAVYKTFGDLGLKPLFSQPVDLGNYWIRQRFLNPYRQFWGREETDKVTGLRLDYYNHAGVDLASNVDLRESKLDSDELSVYSIFDGQVANIQLNDGSDHGLGNTIIIKHIIDGAQVYSLYAHLSSIKKDLGEGDIIKGGDVIGQIGNSGYGCANYWRIGKDGCDESGQNDTHLHLEIKKAPVLENPERGKICENQNGGKRFCYGYVPDYPTDYGYFNPMEFIFDKK